MSNRRSEGFAYLAAFIACIPIANWMIGNVGAICVHDCPCLVPVAPGLMAPSGMLMIGQVFQALPELCDGNTHQIQRA